MSRHILFVLSLVLFSCPLQAQQSEDYFDPHHIRYENYRYRPGIYSVRLEKAGEKMSVPAIRLNSEEKISLQFDDFNDSYTDYQFRIIHCDANWQASQLSETDYVDGFYTDHMESARHSSATLQPYMHYSLSFPNAQMKPLISGNYLLLVFDPAEETKPVITRRFWVYEQLTAIQANIHKATPIEKRESHQEVDFSISTEQLELSNPYQDIQVIIQPNNCAARAISGLKPMFIVNQKLEYNYDEENTFEGGNEFRNFDIRSTRFQSARIATILTDSTDKHPIVLLKPDERKSHQRYSVEQDLNGYYAIQIYEGRDGEIEGDYVDVHFQLPVSAESDSGSIYLFGALTDWNILPEARMVYSAENKRYEQVLKVKQGYYNYQYLYVPTTGGQVQIAESEGNHWETENDYCLFVYYRPSGSRHQQLIGFKQINSLRQE